MHSQSVARWQHEHAFLGKKHDVHERRTWAVVTLASVMMITEIVGGWLFGSMALVADGLHMSTHVAALSIAAAAYSIARKHMLNDWFSFGTGKLGELAAFASAIILAMVALLIGYESVSRLISPVTIQFGEAIPIAALGLAVNLISAWLLRDHDHHHDREEEEEESRTLRGHDHAHHADHNFRAAYTHVMADAITSILAISALVAGFYFGWVWLDPAIGLVGTAVIAAWAWSLIKSSGAVLLDAVPSRERAELIRERLEVDDDRVTDLHLWRLGPGHLGMMAVVVSDNPLSPDDYKARLTGIDGLSHVNIEVHACPGHSLPSAECQA
jgi:cation diffusion facilitator family transporter